jgi:hypothetical protein
MNRFLFYASARWFGEACLELYICRCAPDGWQVYLLPRPANDPFYPSQLHMPGARKIPTETDREHLTRAIGETPFSAMIDKVEYLISSTFKAKRGTEYADVRRLIVPYDTHYSDFYSVYHLPGNMIEHHKAIIEMVKEIR